MTNPYNYSLSDFNDQFILKRIVLINSGGHAYSEIMLDQHMAMFGSNNVGKTASLAATKLLLFPETSLAKCEQKFGFEGENGYYNGEESHKFYFPTEYSFLVLEVENPTGTFCMALYRPQAASAVTRLDYSRIFIPVTYDQLRPVFWDEEQQIFSKNLGLTALLQFSKSHQGLNISDRKRLIEIMFGSYGTTDGRFCILPLKDYGEESIQAFRNIYNLAFTSASSAKILASAIAALIEMQRGREEERLNSTLQQEYDNFIALAKHRDHLDLLDNHNDSFLSLSERHHHFKIKTEGYSELYHLLNHWLMLKSSRYQAEAQENFQKLQNAQTHFREIKQESQKIQQELNQIRGQHIARTDDLEKIRRAIQNCEQIIGEYPDCDVSQILNIYQQSFNEHQLRLEAYQNKENAVQQFENNQKKISSSQLNLEQLQQKLAQQPTLLMSQVKEHTSQIFEMLNPHLNKILSDLSANEVRVLDDFARLFSISKQGRISFKNYDIPEIAYRHFSALAVVQQLNDQLEEEKQKLLLLQKNRDELSRLIGKYHTQEDIQNTVSQIQHDMRLCSSNIQILEAYAVHKNQLSESQLKVQALETDIRQLEEKFTELQQLKDQAEQEVQSLSTIQNKLKDTKESFENVKSTLNKAQHFYAPRVQHTDLADIRVNIESLKEIRQKSYDLLDQANALSKENTEIIHQLKTFMQQVPAADIERHIEHPTALQIEEYIAKYRSIYATLAYQRHEFSNAVIQHNRALYAQIDEIEEASRQLNHQIQLINQKLNGRQISNLINVQLDLRTVSNFDTLSQMLEKFNVTGSTLAEPEFYNSLLQFFKNHQNKRTGRLKMADLIDSIQYVYSKQGRYEKVSQSKGTTNTIHAFIISILLAEIKQADMRVKLPIVVDEIAALDANNSQTTIEQITQQGFSIFCATPEFNAHIAEKVGSYIFIDQYRSQQILHEACQLHILPQHINAFGELKNEA